MKRLTEERIAAMRTDAAAGVIDERVAVRRLANAVRALLAEREALLGELRTAEYALKHIRPPRPLTPEEQETAREIAALREYRTGGWTRWLVVEGDRERGDVYAPPWSVGQPGAVIQLRWKSTGGPAHCVKILHVNREAGMLLVESPRTGEAPSTERE